MLIYIHKLDVNWFILLINKDLIMSFNIQLMLKIYKAMK